MFGLERVEDEGGDVGLLGWELKLNLTPEAQERLLAAVLPPVVLTFGVVLLLRGTEHVWRAASVTSLSRGSTSRVGSALDSACVAASRASGGVWALVVLAATSAVFLVSSMHLLALHQPLLHSVYRWPPAVTLYHTAQPWRISSGRVPRGSPIAPLPLHLLFSLLALSSTPVLSNT